jgi:pimeloyl-ACP methyl ester carboxylesterase
MRRFALAFALVLAGGASAASAANAAITWTKCSGSTSFQCARVPVPLDPSGQTPGTITLTVERKVAATNPTNTAVVALAGGPGQAAVPLADGLADDLKAGLGDRDLLVFDQRGTGSSHPLKCKALDADSSDFLNSSLTKVESACANEIGASRAFYTTAQSVADIEALRVAAGYSKLVLFGVSYGTKVAEEYAQTYPANVAGLILDSVVTPTGPDAFNQTTFTAIPRVLADLCGGGACNSATPSVTGDLTAVLKSASLHPLHGTVIDGRGVRIRVPFGSQDIFNVLLAGDLNPGLRALVPAALHAARKGDTAPLARVVAHAEGLNDVLGLQSQTEIPEDEALFLDTTCEESPLPWPRTVTDPTQRKALAKAAVAALPTSQFAPFSRADVLASQAISLCLGWPQASPPPPTLGPFPTTPTLILEGQADLRTTVADAQSVASQIPGSTLVVVPHNGHSVLTTDPSGCAQKAVNAFLTGAAPQQCAADTPNEFSPVSIAPTSLAKVAGANRKLKTALAAHETIVDEFRMLLTDAITVDHAPDDGSRVGGLRGGFSRLTPSGLQLVGVSYVPGLKVSGTVSVRTLAGTVTVTGTTGAHGKLKFSSSGAVSGTLDGQPFHATPHAAARAARATTPVAGWPSLTGPLPVPLAQ